jgi:CheY-like chemotaxis protein
MTLANCRDLRKTSTLHVNIHCYNKIEMGLQTGVRNFKLRNVILNGWKILVVEDDPDGQELIGRLLRRHGVACDLVYDAEDALDCLSREQYSGVVIDLVLPEIDGWTLLKKIKANTHLAGLPCIAISAYHNPTIAADAARAGFTNYFAKPLEVTPFMAELQQLIDSD